MQKEYILQGLDCAHCASKIVDKINTLESVKSASLNFATKTLKIEYNTDAEKVCVDIIKSIEPDVKVVLKSCDAAVEEKSVLNVKNILVICGFLLFLTTLLPFIFGTVKLIITLISYLLVSYSVIVNAVKKVRSLNFIDENFLMLIATVGALIISESSEAIAVMVFYQIGEFFQDLAVGRSRRSILALMDIKPDTARVVADNEERIVSPDQVKIGDVIKVLPGEKVPLDGVIIKGNSQLDTSALTGESIPRDVSENSEALSGCINLSGVIYLKVTKTFDDSTVSKILKLIETASEKKAPAENFITKFARVYTPCVVLAALLIAVIPPLIFGNFYNWLYRALTFLVVSCPCALVISIPLSYFSAIGAASKRGILVKGGNYLEALSNVKTVVFDKTGTLTTGKFKVESITPYNGFSKEDVLKYAAVAESGSNHPIARSVVNEFSGEIDAHRITEYTEIAALGIQAVYEQKRILAGNLKLMQTHHIQVPSHNSGTAVYIAIDGVLAGKINICDELKSDAVSAVKELKNSGIQRIVMLTGDSKSAADVTAKQVGVDDYHYQLLPDQKVELVEKYGTQNKPNHKLAFVGDGINDAPVIAMADVGIAMGGMGSDSAIEAADIVLMTDEPSRVVDAVLIAKKTKGIVLQNIVFALGVKAIVLILSGFGIANMWLAIFADVGVSLLAVVNSMRMLRFNMFES
ncbi:MAG: cadmium-translocating P-type ATPase [Clostridia bacterium]|nr:cadmium-translocating P-type ATPase [Clostridia bacterium]